VLFLASGTPESIDALLNWARRGPSLARVDALDVEDVDEAPPATFEVRF
jgi:acylphosphatase